MRRETDTMGTVEVPDDRYWGAQTARALEHFPIATQRLRWPRAVIRALGLVKQAAALANGELGELPGPIAAAIAQAAGEVADGRFDEHFPLGVYQSGSGTQTHMNANEVIANRAIEILGGRVGSRQPVHPNDHVNRGQSTNDVFPTVMHLAIAAELRATLLPALDALRGTLQAKAREHAALAKVGRTHLQDAAPITLGQEIGAWATQLAQARVALEASIDALGELALGGTAVGSGLNAHPRLAALCVRELAASSGLPLREALDKAALLAAHDAVVATSAALRTLAMALLKIVNDVRWLASGPRCGIGELVLPANEPGSSIMPGKVNPTQCEALAMVCVRVFGNDATVAFAGSQGSFQLNAYKPLMLHAVLDSLELLAGGIAVFDRDCARGVEPDRGRIAEHLELDLMRVTALNPLIGYDAAARIAHDAQRRGVTLREAALASGLIDAATFDRLADALAMALPHRP
ncbi:fumarate hydratase class II [mine drainage metagenome]|uniref:fumarate hydratase n=1 Tax=mine drainage metagenome TaxID=410659 RepID=A0A1J5R1Q6_9ZZZZ